MDTSKRLEMCHFMQNAGMKLHLPQVGIATAIVYFHRFYARHSKEEYDPFMVATTCLFLAGKVVDTFSKLQVVVDYALHLYENRPQVTDKDKFRKDVLRTERVILKTIAFDFNSQHPYTFVVSYVKSLGGNQEHLQIAWNWVNDSLKTTLCLRYRPEQIAAAAVLLAAKLLKTAHYKHVLEHPDELFCEEKLDVLEEIYVQILDLYENCPGVTSLKRRGISATNEESKTLMMTQSAQANSVPGFRAGGTSEKIDVPRFPFKSTGVRPPASQSKHHPSSLPGLPRPAQKLPPVERKLDHHPAGSSAPSFGAQSSQTPNGLSGAHSNGSNKIGSPTPPASFTQSKVDSQNTGPNLLESGEIVLEPLVGLQHKMNSHDKKDVRYSPY